MSASNDKLRSAAALLGCIDAVRNGPALAVLLGTFSASGLLLAMLAQALARGQAATSVLYGLLALAVAFYGGNAAGLLVMDDAKGVPRRSVFDAFGASLRTAHRLLGALLLIAITYAAGAFVLAVVLLVCKTPLLGPVAFTLVLPVAVVVVGLALLALPTVIVPLAAPAVWDGADTLQCVNRLFSIARRQLLDVALMMLLVGVLATVIGALVMFVVLVGGQTVARLSALILGPEASAVQLMAGLRGFGVRSLAGAGVNVGASAYAVAGVIGGGVVATIGMVLPGLVYLRGACAVYLVHRDRAALTAAPVQRPMPARHTAAPSEQRSRGPAPRGILEPTREPSSLDTTITMARSPLQHTEPHPHTVDVDLPLGDVAPAMRCAACRHPMLAADRFCGVCGAPVESPPGAR
nr:hypothetical protein [uncultured Caldimonas sp.]